MASRTAVQPLLERQRELDVLEARCRDAAEGQGGMVVVEGPAGVGKTALLEAARGAAVEAGLSVLAASGTELERELAFGVVRQLFERSLRTLTDDERRDLLTGAAALAGPVVLDPQPAPPQPEAVYAAMHGLYWLTAGLAARDPLLMVVDDAHWADAASLRWLAYLGRRLDGVPLLLLLARRDAEPGADSQTLDRVSAEADAHVMRPRPLTEAGIDRVLARAYGRSPAPEFVQACAIATGGNPLLLRELSTALRADGRGPDAEVAAQVSAIAPASIARGVLLRLAPLGPDAAHVAQATAVLLSDARLNHVAALAGVPLERAAELADRLTEAGITRAGDPLVFEHPILRAAVYNAMPAAARGLAHLAAAEGLLNAGTGLERAAPHLVRAPAAARDWVVAALRDAAAAAMRRGAPEAAVSLLTRALAEPPADRAAVLLELAAAGSVAHDPASLTHARDAMDTATTPEQRARAAILAARGLVLTGRFTDAQEVLNVVAPVLEALDPGTRRAVQAERLIQTAWHRGVRDLSQQLDALSVETLSGETAEERLLLALHAMNLVVSGRPHAATLDFHRRLLALEDPTPITDEHRITILARGLAIADAVDEARAVLTSVIDGGRRQGAIVTVATACAMRAETEIRAGRLAHAEADAREALAIAFEHDIGVLVPTTVAHLIEVALDREPMPAALTLLAEHGFEDDPIPPGYTGHTLLHARGKARAAAGDPVAAAADFRACGRAQLEWGDRNPATLPWRSSLALAIAALHQHEEAARLVADELRLARRFGANRAIGIALRTQALLHRGDDRIAGLRDAEQTLAPSSARLEHGRTLLELGAALRRSGRRIDARTTLAQALDETSRCGAHQLAARARAELNAAGARPRRERLRGPEALTASERRVAELAAQGQTNRQIAQALFVTTKTVEMHLGRAYAKLDICGRHELAATLADPDPEL